MTTYLPDVNVLIALIDPSHVHHERAHSWFASSGRTDWVTVPITENGVLRIASHPGYSNTQPLPVVMTSLRSLCATDGHRFEADSISLLDGAFAELLSSAQVTDSYLIGLSRFLRAKLATFDRKIALSGVPDAKETVSFIP